MADALKNIPSIPNKWLQKDGTVQGQRRELPELP